VHIIIIESRLSIIMNVHASMPAWLVARRNKILESPQNYVETTQYFSWERYFSSLLRLATSGRSGLVYSKEQLPDAYKQEPAVKKILNVMDKIEFEDTGH